MKILTALTIGLIVGAWLMYLAIDAGLIHILLS